MTTELTVFSFDPSTNIRTVMIDGEPHFVAKDICEALGIKNNKDAIRTLRTNYESIGINADKIVSTHPISDSMGRLQGTIIVTESGLYDLIAQSRKPNALKFKYWISSEVLPSIQKKDDNIPNKMMIITEKEILGKIVTVYGTPESPLFLAIEVAEWIEYDSDNINKFVLTVEEDEKLTGKLFRSGQNREMWFLTEDGLYEVLMQSQKPIAKQFKSKVKEILKDIRKNGFYGTESFVDMALNNTDNLIVILQKYKSEKQSRQLAEQQRDEAIRTKAQIGSKREATSMAHTAVLKKENEKLKTQIGNSERYKQVTAILWLKEFFNMHIEAIYKVVGKRLSTLSTNLEIATIDVESIKYNTVKAYDIDVINYFKQQLMEDKDKTIMTKYRLN